MPATREFIDYELRAGGQARAIVEAKAVRHSVDAQHSAQCVQYASVLGVRWCLITNGVEWRVYDAHAKGPLDAKHLATIRLDSGPDAARAWSILSMFSHDALERSTAPIRLLIERTISDELTRPDSSAVNALRRAVKERYGATVNGDAIVAAIRQLDTVASIDHEPKQAKSTDSHGAPSLNRNDRGRVGLPDLIRAGVLPPDAEIECRLYRNTVTARVRDGRIELRGRLFSTPSAAAAFLRDGKASNGWVIWKYNGELLAVLRDRVAGQAKGS